MATAIQIDQASEHSSESKSDSVSKEHRRLPTNFLERMAGVGALAPSGDNLQPWSFDSDREVLLVKHDPKRDLSLFNVRYSASFIALGAALENIAIAASKDGFKIKLEYFPMGQDDELVARVSFESGALIDPLVEFLGKRCTNRRPYSNKSLDPSILRSLDVTNKSSTAGLFWVQDRTKLKELGKITARADRLIFENPRIHSHLFSTLRWSRAEIEQTCDGLPIASLELGRLGSIAFRGLKNWPVVRFLNQFGFSKAAANRSVLLMRRSSAAGLITVPDTSPLSFVEAGRAFQRVWLQATKNNLALQPMTAVIFLQLKSRLGDYEGLIDDQINIVDGLRRDLQDFYALASDVVPVMLFRIGFAAPPSDRTRRRLSWNLLNQ